MVGIPQPAAISNGRGRSGCTVNPFPISLKRLTFPSFPRSQSCQPRPIHPKKKLNPTLLSIHPHDRHRPTQRYQRITGDTNKGTRSSMSGTFGQLKPAHPLIPLNGSVLEHNRILAIALNHALSIF